MTQQVKDFRPARKNANKHTARGMGALQKSIQSDGWIGAMTTAADGEMIAGSARIETVAQVFGTDAEPIIVESDGTRPIVVVRKDIPNADDKRAQRLALADNRVHEIDLTWDAEVLAGFDADVLGDLWTPEELSDLGQQWADEQRGKQEDAGAQIDKAEELRVKWGVESGQLWQLGDHRLICGDCTDKAVVDKVMQGEVGLVLSDPPYGIEIVQNNSVGGENLAAVGFYSPVIGDETTETSKSFYQTCIDYGFVDFVIWGGNYFSDFLPPKPCWVIWDKRGDIASNNFADCEMAWTSKDAPARIHKQIWMGMIKEREHGKRLHPTQKPIELMEFCINLFGAQIIYDGFLGSGTTLIACERLGRKCRAVEISPGYCAVAIERWAQTTGGTPILANGA